MYKAVVYIHLVGDIDAFNILAPHQQGGCYLYSDYLQYKYEVTLVGK